MKQNKKRPFLVRAFRKAVFTTLAICGLYTGWYLALYAGRGEKLTRGETEMVKGIFGNEVNPSSIRKHFRSESSIAHIMPRAAGMVMPPFSHVDFYGPKNHQRDFSKAAKEKFGLFMHEVTHCWQGQTMNFSAKAFRRYDYKLTPKSKFRDFGTEQQAEIIEDYAERWLYPDTAAVKRTPHDTLLFKVVEARFPQAHKTRVQFQKSRTLKT
ncbi:MAG: hypothetical protein ACAH83_00095 [Alphaproteobacteria bacterium]